MSPPPRARAAAGQRQRRHRRPAEAQEAPPRHPPTAGHARTMPDLPAAPLAEPAALAGSRPSLGGTTFATRR